MIDVVDPAQGDYTVIEPVKELPYYIRANCYAYTRLRYPSLPTTRIIQANIQKEPAEVIVMQYGHLPHYAVVESVGTSSVTISETNYGATKKNIREVKLTDVHLRGFFDI